MRLNRPIFALALSALCATQAQALGSSGAYLAARQAAYDSNYEQATNYYAQALSSDASNPDLMDSTIAANLSLGRVDRAIPIAERMRVGGFSSQLSDLVLLAEQISAEEYGTIVAEFDNGKSIGVLLDGLVRAWALFGDGKVADALAAFDAVSRQQGLKSFALYHKALALAAAGDFENADEILSGRAEGTLSASRRSIQAHAEILSQLDRPQDAIDLIEATFGATPAPLFDDMRGRLGDGQKLTYDAATNATEGMAEVFNSVAAALTDDVTSGYALVYSRIAEYLRPGFVDSLLQSAEILERQERYELATAAYDKIPREDPSFIVAEIGRAEALKQDDKPDAAVEVLSQLSKDYPDMLIAQLTLGDTLRQLERFAEAVPAYDRAIALIGDAEPQHWVAYFSRGIAEERTDQWEKAEADFRRALELQPDQAQVLNYLGYSLVEKHESLDEALDMIERAVVARPNDGYIVDSLGWAQYRLGRYAEAVKNMEKAAALEPVDPIVNDHLGDVYWAVGRQIEAQFQWRRALSFDPEEKDAVRIRRKLEVGLDAVLKEEGAKPIAVAKEG